MFSTLTARILLGAYIFVLLSIPVGAYFISQAKISQPKATVPSPTPTPTPKPVTSPARQLLDSSLKNLNTDLTTPSPTSAPTATSPEIATSFGPTLSFTTTLEGRTENQTVKMFIGIVEGSLGVNPKFLLSFSVDLPTSGKYSNLSLAGLSPGTRYTALLKGSAQIATSAAFTMSPNVTNLNSGQAINLISGDLNEDNAINSQDLSVAQKALGANSKSPNWNENADLNKDGVINVFDLGIISKNLSQIGASGIWTSPIPKAASSSASLNSLPVGSPEESQGYWLWIPNL